MGDRTMEINPSLNPVRGTAPNPALFDRSGSGYGSGSGDGYGDGSGSGDGDGSGDGYGSGSGYGTGCDH